MSDQLTSTGKRMVSIGDDVHYVLDEGRSLGECRPAKVVQVWDNDANQCVNLQVFLDGINDGLDETGLHWATSVITSNYFTMGQWHWPEDCPHQEM